MTATARNSDVRRAGRWLLRVAILATSLGIASRANAGCTVRIESSVAFGTYNVFSVDPLDSIGQISYHCTGTTNPVIQISLSRGSSPTFLPRQLRHGTDVLTYNLYSDTNRMIVWGDGSPGAPMFTAGREPGRVSVNIYGRIPAGQDAGVGAYTDVVTVVVNF